MIALMQQFTYDVYAYWMLLDKTVIAIALK